MDIGEIFESAAFWILTAVGYIAFTIMIITLNRMGNAELMPFWVKIATILVIPVAAALFSGYAEGG